MFHLKHTSNAWQIFNDLLNKCIYNKRQYLPFAHALFQAYVSYFGKMYVGLRFNLSVEQISDRPKTISIAYAIFYIPNKYYLESFG